MLIDVTVICKYLEKRVRERCGGVTAAFQYRCEKAYFERDTYKDVREHRKRQVREHKIFQLTEYEFALVGVFGEPFFKKYTGQEEEKGHVKVVYKYP